jgi:hypothetical protein
LQENNLYIYKGMKKLILIIIALLIAGAAAAWFFNRNNDKARCVLPADATSVVVFEPAELITGLGLKAGDFKNLPADVEDLLEAIDLTKPVYAFSTESGKSGISMSLKDSKTFVQKISSAGFADEEQQGLRWRANGSCIGCIDKDKLLVFAPVNESQQNELRPEMTKLMRQSKQNVPVLNNLADKGFLRISTALDNLPKEFTAALPQGINLHDARLNAAFGIGKKDITVSAALQTPKPLMEEDFLRPIKGSPMNIGSADPLFSLCMNINGESLLNQLRKVPQIREALLGLNMAVDVDMMLKAIDGDVMLAVPKLDLQNPDIIFTASLANTDFLKNAEDWDGVKKRGASDFVASFQGSQAYFGVKDNCLYLTTSASLANNTSVEGELSTLQSQTKGKYLSASLNAAQIIKSYPAISIVLAAMPQLRESVEAIDGVTLYANSPQSYELSLKTNKPIKDVVGNLKGLITGK